MNVYVRERALKDALDAGVSEGEQLDANGSGAVAYADAIATYLGMTISRLADLGNALCGWEPNAECPRHLFTKQAIPMAWEFAEGNPLGDSSGSWETLLEGTDRAFSGHGFNQGGILSGGIAQADAASRSYQGMLISTDPPYYDNIDYSDLSDFFYVWLRRALRGVHPELLSTMLVPKTEELVANPYRHGDKDRARSFFEDGFRQVFTNACKETSPDFPIAVWYAFKQSDSDESGTGSTGWETLLDGMIRGGWAITATWPNRSESGNRMLSQGSNVLASSIVLSLRPRLEDAPTTDRPGFIAALKSELPDALRNLQQGQIAPVDLPQAAIGPGMAVFSRYTAVLEPDGSTMGVRSALTRINEILDQVLNEQEGDFDPTTRFAVAWYRQHGYDTGRFGDADNLARARNTSVERMDREQILTSRAGEVTLVKPSEMPADYDVLADGYVSEWEVLQHIIRLVESDGVPAAGAFLATAQGRPDGAVEADVVKELAFLLFSIAEKNRRTQDAMSFNAVAQSWGDVLAASNQAPDHGVQTEMVYDEED